MATVLVSGASGFIALHIVDILLKKGYTVIATVRTTEEAVALHAKFEQIHPGAKLTFEIVPNIAANFAFEDALRGHPEIEYVIHTTSIAFGVGEDAESVFLKPAVNSTVNMFASIKKWGKSVRHVVFTSSLAAIMLTDKIQDSGFVHTEETWNDMDWDEAKTNQTSAYCAAKTLAERAAREFVRKEDVKFTLSTVNPTYVLGPQLFQEAQADKSLNAASQLINQALNLDPSSNGPFDSPSGLAVDVRDVALFHVLPLEDPEKFANSRLFMAQSKFCLQTILDVIRRNFPELQSQVPKGDSKAGEDVLKTTVMNFDNSKTLELADATLISFEKTICDSVRQVIDSRRDRADLRANAAKADATNVEPEATSA
ncbi:unnamed protein product [Kuraishia capsulata CBS 1993]|uniref:NAD-dependent epimerase/dehydratase domain-containing protein n=1 Tax=Kuraishia capsulata CBS 1993 TaxID=1382522 RepID=W6MPS8_9ASCO|nr:uncharacterized protein KUCA_T00004640001 [Kuraishia capsulata CBS 1993]CDK28656.1 unnamed protein product [Kuraishia capsulata CBS 1993]